MQGKSVGEWRIPTHPEGRRRGAESRREEFEERGGVARGPFFVKAKTRGKARLDKHGPTCSEDQVRKARLNLVSELKGERERKMRVTQTAMLTTVPEYEVEDTVGYRPPIRPEQMRKLRRLKEETDKPITALVEEALKQYLGSKGADQSMENGSNLCGRFKKKGGDE